MVTDCRYKSLPKILDKSQKAQKRVWPILWGVWKDVMKVCMEGRFLYLVLKTD